MKKRHFIVYALTEPESDVVRYIGKTCEGKNRYWRHVKPSVYNAATSHVYCWIKSLVNKGLRPGWKIIQEFEAPTNEELNQAERYWISYFRSIGAELCNHSDGGDGPWGAKVSEETKKKLREANLGKKQSKETVEKRRKKHIGFKWTEEAKKAFSAKVSGDNSHMRGRKLSESTRLKQSESQKRARLENPDAFKREFKAVKCSNGMEFKTALDVADYFKIDKTTIYRCCKSGKPWKGLTFSYTNKL